jgi:hypothetical protein
MRSVEADASVQIVPHQMVQLRSVRTAVKQCLCEFEKRLRYLLGFYGFLDRWVMAVKFHFGRAEVAHGKMLPDMLYFCRLDSADLKSEKVLRGRTILMFAKICHF